MSRNKTSNKHNVFCEDGSKDTNTLSYALQTASNYDETNYANVQILPEFDKTLENTISGLLFKYTSPKDEKKFVSSDFNKSAAGKTCNYQMFQLAMVTDVVLSDKEELSITSDDTKENMTTETLYTTSGSIYSELNSDSSYEYEESFCVDDYSNKVLFIHKEYVEVVKTKLQLDKRNKMVFVMDNDLVNEIHRNEFHLDDLHYRIANALGIHPQNLMLTYFSKDFSDIKNGYMNIELSKILQPLKVKSMVLHSKSNITPHPININDVEVDNLEKEKNTLIVGVFNTTKGKQWCGGFRNLKTGNYYCNAATQTYPRQQNYGRPVWKKLPQLCSRDAQTHKPYKEIGINCPIDHSTQMCRSNLYIPADTDVIISPRYFIPYDTFVNLREKAAVVIQKFWRGHKVRSLVLPKAYEDFIQYKILKELLLKEKTIEADPLKQSIFNTKLLDMIFPYKRKHFYQLHWILNKFKQDKIKGIYNNIFKQANLNVIYQKGSELLREIEGQRISAKEHTFLKQKTRCLEDMSVPLAKKNVDKNSLNLIELYGTERCRQFKELYFLIRKKDISREERLEVLVSFMQLLETYGDFEMKDELLDLIERESILLSSGIPSMYLKMLRNRTEEIIHHFVISTDSQSGAGNYRPPANIAKHRCKSCKKYQPKHNFPVHLKMDKSKKCKACLYKYRASCSGKSFDKFSDLLVEIRKDEYRRGCINPYITLIHSEDLQFIIHNIWGGHSVLSNESIISELRLPRWDNRKPWAPWNCILLTAEEAKAHETIENVHEFYAEEFCLIIKYRNLRSFCEFGKICEIENICRNIWVNLSEDENYVTLKSLLNAFDVLGDNFFHPPPVKRFTE